MYGLAGDPACVRIANEYWQVPPAPQMAGAQLHPAIAAARGTPAGLQGGT